MPWESKDKIRRDRDALQELVEIQRNAATELNAQIAELSRGLGMMRSLWPALQPLITFENPHSEHWQLDVRSLEIMVAVVKFGPEIQQQLKDGAQQMIELVPVEVSNDTARD